MDISNSINFEFMVKFFPISFLIILIYDIPTYVEMLSFVIIISIVAYLPWILIGIFYIIFFLEFYRGNMKNYSEERLKTYRLLALRNYSNKYNIPPEITVMIAKKMYPKNRNYRYFPKRINKSHEFAEYFSMQSPSFANFVFEMMGISYERINNMVR